MSLFSVFYAGDSSVIESAIKDGRIDVSSGTAVQRIDFSGGIAHPYIFPSDFLALTEGGASSFWHLKKGSLVEGDEHGFYRLPDKECDKLIGLTDDVILGFSRAWNARLTEDYVRSERAASIWRSAAFWKITGGGSLGLLLSCIIDRGSSLSLAMLAGWLVCTLSFGVWLDRSRRRRRKNRGREKAVDWVTPLKELRGFLLEARRTGSSVYYYWSL